MGCGSSTRYSSIPCGVGLYSVSIVFRLCDAQCTCRKTERYYHLSTTSSYTKKKCSTRYYSECICTPRTHTWSIYAPPHNNKSVCRRTLLPTAHTVLPPHDTGISTTDEVRPQEYFLLQQNYSPSG